MVVTTGMLVSPSPLHPPHLLRHSDTFVTQMWFEAGDHARPLRRSSAALACLLCKQLPFRPV